MTPPLWTFGSLIISPTASWPWLEMDLEVPMGVFSITHETFLTNWYVLNTNISFNFKFNFNMYIERPSPVFGTNQGPKFNLTMSHLCTQMHKKCQTCFFWWLILSSKYENSSGHNSNPQSRTYVPSKLVQGPNGQLSMTQIFAPIGAFFPILVVSILSVLSQCTVMPTGSAISILWDERVSPQGCFLPYFTANFVSFVSQWI